MIKHNSGKQGKIAQTQYDSFAEVYSKSRALQHGMLLATWQVLRQHFPDRRFQRILDLGCGTGSLIDLIQGDDPRYCGVDISPKVLELATEKAAAAGIQASLVCADISHLPMESESFDLVFSNSVIHWLNGPDLKKVFNAVGETHRVLQGGGIFVGSVSGTGTASRFLNSYRSVISKTVAVSKVLDEGAYDPIGSMKLECVVEALDRAEFNIISAANVYQPVSFPSILDYLAVVQAYGFEMFMEPVEESHKEEVWLEVKAAAAKDLSTRPYIHDQYVVYFLAEKKRGYEV